MIDVELKRPEGYIGTVTGRVGPDTLGEVMIPIRGGIEAFLARPFDGHEEIPEGAEAMVISYEPPRMVYVARPPEFE